MFKNNKMAETLGSLIDKLTIVKLKQWHSEETERLKSLSLQEEQLKSEIDIFVNNALSGAIPLERLIFQSNKVYKKDNIQLSSNDSINIGKITSDLAEINCRLWHEQEKVYDFENVPVDEKDKVVHNIAVLNLERNQCIDKIDRNLQLKISNNQKV